MPSRRPPSDPALDRVLGEVARRGEISFASLARATALRPATLKRSLRALDGAGLVIGDSDGKRVGLNAAYGCVVGIDLGASNLRLALADFGGRALGTATEKIRPEDGPRKMIARIEAAIRGLLAAPPPALPVARRSARNRNPLRSWPGAPRGSRAPLRSIAIGVPSPVDPERGVVAFANNLPGWRNIRLGRELERAFRVPVFLENDANLAAIGEHWRGVARGVENFVFVALGTGIGSGIFTHGRLYRGRTGNAGELYRLNVEWPRWNEDFGDVGYFESHVAGLGIAAEGRRALGGEGRSGGLVQERDAQFVFERFRQGDARARAVLEKVFTILGVGLADVVAILDPDLLVFGGGVVQGAPEFLLQTVERVVRRIHPDIAPPIRFSSLGENAQIYGALGSALEVAREAALARLQASTRASAAAEAGGGGR